MTPGQMSNVLSNTCYGVPTASGTWVPTVSSQSSDDDYGYGYSNAERSDKKKPFSKRSKGQDGKTPASKNAWTSDKDLLLKHSVEMHAHQGWSAVSSEFNKACLNQDITHKDRTGKQCRERWENYLKPGLRKGDYTEPEFVIIMLLQEVENLRNKWAQLKNYLPGRSDNSIKNQANSKLKNAETRTKLMEKSLEYLEVVKRERADDLVRQTNNSLTFNEAIREVEEMFRQDKDAQHMAVIQFAMTLVPAPEDDQLTGGVLPTSGMGVPSSTPKLERRDSCGSMAGDKKGMNKSTVKKRKGSDVDLHKYGKENNVPGVNKDSYGTANGKRGRKETGLSHNSVAVKSEFAVPARRAKATAKPLMEYDSDALELVAEPAPWPSQSGSLYRHYVASSPATEHEYQARRIMFGHGVDSTGHEQGDHHNAGDLSPTFGHAASIAAFLSNDQYGHKSYHPIHMETPSRSASALLSPSPFSEQQVPSSSHSSVHHSGSSSSSGIFHHPRTPDRSLSGSMWASASRSVPVELNFGASLLRSPMIDDSHGNNFTLPSPSFLRSPMLLSITQNTPPSMTRGRVDRYGNIGLPGNSFLFSPDKPNAISESPSRFLN
eukprot:GILJ01009629.1.p1 GENE.GILJ01009629.1~~GILJ01009629.1.p1  ORF type:complete len:614 (+),score=66.01 GILJ01009629.1:33-1844(+)